MDVGILEPKTKNPEIARKKFLKPSVACIPM